MDTKEKRWLELKAEIEKRGWTLDVMEVARLAYEMGYMQAGYDQQTDEIIRGLPTLK
ncbi:hypothetical protein PP175_26070 (plasmid) [Aneurinibacillus sp. Ricciae_BoGa-3]|uniref:hypothetical protein n=1 Tax=Aneurinibacillus sp. Ricciae_BoGa-3 TaxID=3022697 RepID=UPI00234133AA|nr:hypothetical protein [Aneurinibacillus sp. Ricciae_BoGa-3]WCK57534.1 hypothetical protein PP175_26070 [Aneurinibacillus sp. Ricciae_BoGa-3]